MIDIEKLISELPDWKTEQRAKPFRALLRLAQASDAIEPQSHQDLVPIDVPIESHKDAETGVLRIKYPFVLSLRNNLSWKEIEVTPAAQKCLVEIFSESLDEDAKAGRIQSISTLTQ